MIRIGLLGASRIAPGAVLLPAAERDDVEVTCIAASDPERARAFASEHGIAHVVADYSALISSEQVDLVYNALPPSAHKQWSTAALRAGKHVLCEKPFAMNAVEAQVMVAAAEDTGNILIEAFHYRFHPLFQRVLDLMRSGVVGTVQRLESCFNVPIQNRDGELRFAPTLGGGAMMDLGCYPVHWARTAMNSEPEVLSARARVHETGVDVAMQAELRFAGGVHAIVESSMSQEPTNRFEAKLSIHGDQGILTVVNPLSPHTGHELIVETGAGERREHIDGMTTYHHQLAHVVAVLEGRTPPLTGSHDAIANMRVLDEIYRQAGMRMD